MRFITAALVAALAAASPLAAQDANEIVARADARGAPDNLSATITLTINSPNGDQRVIRADSYQKQRSAERQDRLFVFTYPPNVRDTALLVQSNTEQGEDSMWMYLPALDRIKRVDLGSSGGGYFLGSDFTFRDLVSRDQSEYVHALLAEDGGDHFVLEVRGRTPELPAHVRLLPRGTIHSQGQLHAGTDRVLRPGRRPVEGADRAGRAHGRRLCLPVAGADDQPSDRPCIEKSYSRRYPSLQRSRTGSLPSATCGGDRRMVRLHGMRTVALLAWALAALPVALAQEIEVSGFLRLDHYGRVAEDQFYTNERVRLTALSQLQAAADNGSWAAFLELVGFLQYGADGFAAAPDALTVRDLDNLIRQAYLSFRFDAFDVDIGKKFVRWGKVDFFSPLDVVNHTNADVLALDDLLEGSLADPLLHVTAYPTDELSIELVYVPFLAPYRGRRRGAGLRLPVRPAVRRHGVSLPGGGAVLGVRPLGARGGLLLHLSGRPAAQLLLLPRPDPRPRSERPGGADRCAARDRRHDSAWLRGARTTSVSGQVWASTAG